VLTLLAILFAALFLGIAVRSHSFKEAQNALTPVYMLAFLPALLPLIPGIDFSVGMALIPVAGVAFLFRDLMGGAAAPLPALIAVWSTVVYTALALAFAARSFGREEVLFGSGDAPGHGRVRGPVPTPAVALALVAVIAVLFFYVARPLMMAWGRGGLALSQWLFLAGPALLLVLRRYDARQTFALRAPSARSVAAAVLIMLGGIPIGWLIAWLQGFILSVPVELLEAMRNVVLAEDPRTLLWLLFVLALTPAICEELVFRGVLLHAFGTRLGAAGAIGASALVFGAFHLSSISAIRFLPTAWLGLLLAVVVWRTRSIVPAMIMHLLNNATVLILIATPALHQRFDAGGGQPPWLLVGIAPFLLVAGWLALPARRDAGLVERPSGTEAAAAAGD
jgi:sodium transport system permease protein